MEAKVYSCISCGFHTQYKQSLVLHEKSKKHMVTIGGTVNNTYVCEQCDYMTPYKHVYQQHMLSAKHIKEMSKNKQRVIIKAKNCDDPETESSQGQMNTIDACSQQELKIDVIRSDEDSTQCVAMQDNVQLLAECRQLRELNKRLTLENEALASDNARLLAARKPRKETIPAKIKSLVWLKYMGDVFSAKCMCCQHTVISSVAFDAGHVIPESSGGKVHVANLRPICKSCNCSMGKKLLPTYALMYFPSSPLCNIDIETVLEECNKQVV